jgi:hypothetical protein
MRCPCRAARPNPEPNRVAATAPFHRHGTGVEFLMRRLFTISAEDIGVLFASLRRLLERLLGYQYAHSCRNWRPDRSRAPYRTRRSRRHSLVVTVEGTMGSVRPLWTHRHAHRTGYALHLGNVNLLGRRLNQPDKNPQSRAKNLANSCDGRAASPSQVGRCETQLRSAANIAETSR